MQSRIPAFTTAALAAGLMTLAGCATTSSGEGTKIDRYVITRAEIEENLPSTAYELVHKLRPRWLRGRGRASFRQDTDVAVYLDGTRMGEREELRTIDGENIRRLEFLDARRATVRFGAGHVRGAILVMTSG